MWTERGLLIAIEAGRTADTYEAHDALRELLAASRLKTVLRGHEGQVYNAQFSPDGQRIVISGCEKVIVGLEDICTEGSTRVWDATTGQQLVVLGGHKGWLSSAQFSPDGQRIVTTDCETVVDYI